MTGKRAAVSKRNMERIERYIDAKLERLDDAEWWQRRQEYSEQQAEKRAAQRGAL